MEQQQLLTAEDLLLGTQSTFDVVIPEALLGEDRPFGSIVLKPLSIGTFNLILKAAKNDMGMMPLLMIKESLVAPELTLEQVKKLQLGLSEFIVNKIRTISGLHEKKKLTNGS